MVHDQTIKIMIDLTQIPIQKTGVGVYGLNLVKSISESDINNIYYIIVQDDEKSLNYITNKNFKFIRVKKKLFRKFILRWLLEQFYIPYLIFKFKIDVVHSLHYSFPIVTFGAKKVVTIHDMTFFKYPEMHIRIKKYYFKFFITIAPIFADKLIFISQSTLNDFRKLFHLEETKASVIYHGVSQLFNPNIDRIRINFILNKYNIDKEYLLFIGTIEPRKNIKNIILSYYKLLNENSGYKLVIAGKKGWHFNEIFELIDELKLNEKIIFTGFINEDDKPFLIAGAKIFIYPSMYEGFGIPVLESISCGIPTITSNVSSLPEVVEDAAILINPLDVDELFLSMQKVLNDKNLYDLLKRKSILQANKFSWNKTAQKTIQIYNDLKE